MTVEKAIEILSDAGDINRCCAEDAEALDMAIKALEQQPILDKIRAEIEQKARPNEIGGRGNGKSIRYGLCMALEIIDKYKAESENQ
ncbi:MAG: hypothetical protein IJJ74_01230 [Eubacterium sp.]|nr:hypothetical protein [Eubacterium sp.]MBR0395906.1 hypothetical protein [Clostridiales bacterium]